MQIEKILILGAGAIGQVIGTHLRLSGCDVSFWVRPYQVDQFTEKGIKIYNLKTETELHISAPHLVTELPNTDYDAIFLCVRSDQLDAALADLKSQLGDTEDKLIVCLQPGREDALKTFRALPEMVIIPGAPAFSAYPKNDRIEYWAPKSIPTLIGPPFNETLHVRDELVRLLSQGGIPTKGVNDLEAEVRFPSVFLSTTLAGFNLAGYSLKAMSQNKKLLELTAQGIREGVAITKKDLGFIPIKYKFLEHMSGSTLSGLFWFLENTPGLSFMQTMWGTHAPKIKTQTYSNLDDLLSLSLHQSKTPPPALTALSAMTPEKIGEYLKTSRQFSSQDPKKKIKMGVALGLGSMVAWKLLSKKRS